MNEQRVAGRYRLLREIGRGAGGAVWLAQDEVLGRRVAMKHAKPAFDDGHDAVRAEREARLAARVNHPHVVAVFDLVIVDDGSWLVMEYVDGEPLSSLVRREGAVSPDRAARLLRPIADALAAAHELGIVHRDVKPSNILVDRDGVTHLSDFGIARGAQDPTLTRTGLVTGSPAYLSPEVAIGRTATQASDVWAFGATLVHLLTGRPPYHRDGDENGPLAVVHRIASEPPPRPPEAGWLGPLVAATMATDPGDRLTMAQVHDRLVADEEPMARTATLAMAPPPAPPTAPPPAWVPAPPPGPGTSPLHADRPDRRDRKRALTAVAGAAAALVLAVLLFVAVSTGDDDGPVDRRTAPSTSPAATSPSRTEPTTTAAELEQFARSYVETADGDPAAGFAMLTPSYQRESTGYDDFWGPMRDPEILDLSADPATMTVTYTYSYVLPQEGRRTETVTLQLVDDGGTLLISGAR
ncbi:MAG TPA: serine/threonine-protein kinase [Nocardioides sp.]|nr:serine/threonine-protein kinase [Nocardioides sp.]